MNFLDGYWKTGSKIRDRDARREYFAAIVEYYYTGELPSFEHESAEVGFEGIFYSLDLARKRSLARSGGCDPGTKRKQGGKKAGTKRGQSADKGESSGEENGNKSPTKEEEGEEEADAIASIPPSPPCPGFADECLMALNEVMGTMYTDMPARCRHVLERAEGRFSVAQVRAMVAYKRREWAATRFRSNLTPNFLFSADHFEQCMNQSAMEGGGGADAGLGKFSKPCGSAF